LSLFGFFVLFFSYIFTTILNQGADQSPDTYNTLVMNYPGLWVCGIDSSKLQLIEK